jgi:thioredoxin 1
LAPAQAYNHQQLERRCAKASAPPSYFQAWRLPEESIIMGKALEITDANFSNNTAEGLTLVDFWAPWCGPCRMVGPVIEELAEQYAGQVKVGKLNVDDNQETAMKFRVMSIPTVILFKDGEPVEIVVGAGPKRNYEARIEKHLAFTPVA